MTSSSDGCSFCVTCCDLRVHLHRYNSSKRARRQQLWCPRLFLHAARLQFSDFEDTDADVAVPLAPDLARVLGLMRDALPIESSA